MLKKKGMVAVLGLLLVLGGCSNGKNSVSESVSVSSSVETTSVVPKAKKFKLCRR
jgi:PBP1b-binding outer membrane lipoprotein LpoB